MNWRELLFLAIVGWTSVGAIGTVISLIRGERAKAAQGAKWLAAIWVIYLAAVIGVSLIQPQKVLKLGQKQCYDEMCFTATNVDEIPRFLGRHEGSDGSRLIRVSVRVQNTGRGKTQSENLIRAYLVDAQGRSWEQSVGVSGNRLTASVEAGGTMVSEPVFRVAGDATGLALVFTHGRWQPGSIVIADSDSLLHKRTVVELGR